VVGTSSVVKERSMDPSSTP